MSLPSSLAAEPGTSKSPSRRRRAQQLATLGGVLLIALPLVMWAANRSAPLVFGLAALAFLVAMLVAGRAPELLCNLAAAIRSPIGLAGSICRPVPRARGSCAAVRRTHIRRQPG
jgi:hypothetical protein